MKRSVFAEEEHLSLLGFSSVCVPHTSQLFGGSAMVGGDYSHPLHTPHREARGSKVSEVSDTGTFVTKRRDDGLCDDTHMHTRNNKQTNKQRNSALKHRKRDANTGTQVPEGQAKARDSCVAYAGDPSLSIGVPASSSHLPLWL